MCLPRTSPFAGRRSLIVLAVGLTACAGEGSPGWYPDEAVREPRLFAPGVVSTEEGREFGLTFSPDGETVYFTRRARRERQKIWVSRFVDGAWTTPELAPFSNSVDESPWIAPDGEAFYFASRRPGVFGADDRSDNLWVMEREGSGWGEPRPVAGSVNRPRPDGARWPVGSQLSPVIGADGALYYWSRGEGDDATSDIYRAEPAGEGFSAGVPVPSPISTEGVESHMAFGPGGILVFQGYGRDQRAGAEDLFISVPVDGGWSLPRLLPPPISTEANEGFPSFTRDGRFFFFASDRGASEGAWSIWYVELEALALGTTGRP